MKLIFATNNQHKVDELKHALPKGFDVITLKEAGIDIDIPEPHETLEENAAAKAQAIYQMTGNDCFSEDSGLEVHALDGAPGAHSAHYAGEDHSADANIGKLLKKMEEMDDRHARFRTVICLIMEGKEYFFEGICEGRITDMRIGTGGFGYDPVFIPDGADRTFAGMSTEEKNRFSHRRKAADMLVEFLNQSSPNKD